MLAGLVWLCCAQAAAPDVTLARLRAHMADILSSMPNYTCEQTVARSVRPARERRFIDLDTLRLEVSFVSGKELYAWPGAGKFEDRGIESLVQGGAIGSGTFASHADALFRGDAALFTFRGQGVENGRAIVEYDFRVPLTKSRFYIKGPGGAALAGYHGRLRADAATLDVIGLEIEVDDIPVKTQVRRSSNNVEYGRRQIGDSQFLLPVAAGMTIVDMQGNENRNRTQFGTCRRYAGSSLISFTEMVPGPASPPVIAAPALPEGLMVEMSLAAPVQGDSVAVGDPVTAIAARDVKKDNAILIPKGASFTGRISRLEKREGRGVGPYVVVGVVFETFASGNARGPFRGHLDEVSFGNLSFHVPFASGPANLTIWSSQAQRPLALPSPGEGILFAKAPLKLPARMRMVWRTIP